MEPVWQKVFTEGKEKYVMVAELNSVVPTFSRGYSDAPLWRQFQPHFDKQSNNVAYWLHWQPQWGMRVKQEVKIVKDKDEMKFKMKMETQLNLFRYRS